MLNVIDVHSKFAWSIPLKDKTGKTVLDAFEHIVKSSGRTPDHIWVDEGKEFYNKHMDKWLKENDIIGYSTHGEHKSAVVERTLKTIMWKRFTAENTRNWIDMLDKLFQYKNKEYSTIKMTPTEASRIVIHNPPKFEENSKFSVGEQVRVSRIKGIFEKGYLPNWSEALYIVHEVRRTYSATYILKDTNGEIIKGGFYTEELQKSKQDVFRIEKVIRRKKINGIERGLVKWMGYDKVFNEWRPISEIKKISVHI